MATRYNSYFPSYDELMYQKQSILTEDDVLHFRRLSCGDVENNKNDDEIVLDVMFTTADKDSLAVHAIGSAPDLKMGRDHRERSSDDVGWIYFPTTPGLTIDALHKHNKDQSLSITSRYGKRRGMGIKIEANGQDVALFHWKDKIYCTDENCPHAGGPLHLGDIEDIETGLTCIICPWHKFCFDLKSGDTIRPNGWKQHLGIHPIKIGHDGLIRVGFHSFNPLYFNDDNF